MTGEQLRAWRTQRGLSLPELATLLGVHPMTPQRWETNRNPIPSYLGLALAYLDTQETWRRHAYVTPDQRLSTIFPTNRISA